MKTFDDLFEKKPETFKEKLEDYWLDIKVFFEKFIEDPYRGVRNFFRNILRYREILWRDYDWDYDFFLSIQDRKLELMEKYHRQSGICMENPWIASRIKMTRSLLEVARELDANKHEESFWTPYVNLKNKDRFIPPGSRLTDEKMIRYTLRTKKAWILYHKALEIYTKSWWD